MSALDDTTLRRIHSALEGYEKKALPQLEKIEAEMKACSDKAAKAEELGGDAKKALGEVERLRTELAEMKAEYEKDGKELKSLQATLAEAQQRHDVALAEMKRVRGLPGGDLKDLGEMFVKSQVYQEFADAWMKSGDSGAPSKSGLFKTEGDLREFKAALTLANSAGLVPLERTDAVTIPRARLFLEDLLRSLPTTASQGDYVEWTDIRAVGDANGTIKQGGAAATISEIQEVPETEFRATTKQWSVKGIANTTWVSRFSLDDAPEIKSEVNTHLVGSVDYTSERQMLLGDGSGTNIKGFLHASAGLSTRLWSAGEVGDNQVDVLRRAAGDVTLKYFAATGIVLHTKKVVNFDILKDGEQRYLLMMVAAEGGRKVLWRLPVIETDAIAENTGLVADFTHIGKIKNRMSTELRMNEDQRWSSNQIGIMATRRLALLIERPHLGVIVTFDEAPEEAP